MSAKVKTSGHRNFPVGAVGCDTPSFNTVQAYRRQHQLALVNTEHREAMRIFILSLQAATWSFPNQAVAPSIGEPAEHPEFLARAEIFAKEDAIDDNSLKKEDDAASTSQAASFTPKDEAADLAKLRFAFQKALSRHDHRASFRLFEVAVNQNVPIGFRQAVDLFFLVSKNDPIASYHVLQYCNAHPNSKGPRLDMYRRLCASIKLLDPVVTHLAGLQEFIESLMLELETMDMDMKKELYPKLVVSLAEQRSVSIGPYARFIYNYMVDHDFEMRPGWLKLLLTFNKYNRQDDIPWHDVLARLVEMGEEPHPLHTIQAVHNMFPFTDPKKMNIALDSMSTLLQQGRNSDDGSLYSQLFLDMATLESISAGAAHIGSQEMIMNVWEIIEQSEYSPSEAIFEHTVVAFAGSDDGLMQAFTALAEMQKEGFEVSRPLIRSISRAIR
jgi:hypothetical protein